jgi:hypothetical protein
MRRVKTNPATINRIKAYHGGVLSDEDIKKIPWHLTEAFIHPLDRTNKIKK